MREREIDRDRERGRELSSVLAWSGVPPLPCRRIALFLIFPRREGTREIIERWSDREKR